MIEASAMYCPTEMHVTRERIVVSYPLSRAASNVLI